MNTATGVLGMLAMLALGVASVMLYFTPSLVAWMVKSCQVGVVAVINMIFGWTLIGWVVALVIALWNEKPEPQPWMPQMRRTRTRRNRIGRLNHRCGTHRQRQRCTTTQPILVRSKESRTAHLTISLRSVVAGTCSDMQKRRTQPGHISSCRGCRARP